MFRVVDLLRVVDRIDDRRPHLRRRRWLIAALVSVLLAAGCGATVDSSAVKSAAEAESPATDPAAAEDPVAAADTAAEAAPSAADSVTASPGQQAAPGQESTTTDGRAACPGVRCVSIAVSGDVLLHPPLVEQARAEAAASGGDLDFAPMLGGQQPYLRTVDLGVCHLETPLADATGPFTGYPSFSGPPQVLNGLVETGYDACTTASNHTLDQGSAGLVRTLDALDAAGIEHDGSYRSEAEAQMPVVIATPNGRVGLISVTYGLNTGEPDEPWMVTTLDSDAVIAKAQRARNAGADLVVVAIHAGTEYDSEPNSEQGSAAKTLLASPAIDLVYGHHAHVVQPLERIGGKWVIYGLGNMIASHETPIDATREGLLVRVTFSQDALGSWTTSDVAWVASLQDVNAPRAWCALTAGPTCTSPQAHEIALARTTEAVNRYGADRDGEHPLELN